ncbi:MAG: cytochrome c biogenesis protein [Thermoanaerobaculia bacterium]|nr:cytochrome c biogenesis protein [Thermoanaerobaculia bacterium]
MTIKQKTFRWLLFVWLAATIWAAFFYAPLSQGFAGKMGDAPQSSRIVFFHVPLAVASFFAFLVAAAWSGVYLWKRRSIDDHRAVAAIEVGMLYCVLATVTGAVWSKVQWGAYWNWDPRQSSIVLALLYYGAYLSLRGAVEDSEVRARLSAVYAVLGFVVAPFLFFILPRMASFSLHPTPGSAEMDREIGLVVVAAIAGFTALFCWIASLRRRVLDLNAEAG